MDHHHAIVIERGEEGGFGAYATDVPGCIAVGKTEQEVLDRIRRNPPAHEYGSDPNINISGNQATSSPAKLVASTNRPSTSENARITASAIGSLKLESGFRSPKTAEKQEI